MFINEIMIYIVYKGNSGKNSEIFLKNQNNLDLIKYEDMSNNSENFCENFIFSLSRLQSCTGMEVFV